MARKTAATPAKKATKKTAAKKTARKSAPQTEAAPKHTSRRRKPEVIEEQVSQKANEQQDEQAFNAYDVNQIAKQAFQAGAEVGEQQTRQHFAERTLEINGLSGRQASLLAETVIAAHDVEKYELLLRDAHAELRRRSLVAVSEVPAGRYVVRGELVEVTPTTVIREHLGQATLAESATLGRVGRISEPGLAISPSAARYR